MIYSAKLNYEPIRSKLPAGFRFYPLVRLRLLTRLLSKYSKEIKTLPSCMYTAHLIFWMVWGAALRSLTTGSRWPCNACVPLLYCLCRNVTDTECLKSPTTSEQHQSGQSLLIIPHAGLQHRFYPQTGVQTSAFTYDNYQHPQSGCCTGLQIHNRAIKKHIKIKCCVFKVENLVGKPLINQSYLDYKLINVVTCQHGAVLLSKYNIHQKLRLGWCDELYQKPLWALLSAAIGNPHSTPCLLLKLCVFGKRL